MKDLRFFFHMGFNFARCALGIYFIFEVDARQYAVAFLLGPGMVMVGIEPKDSEPGALGETVA